MMQFKILGKNAYDEKKVFMLKVKGSLIVQHAQ